MRMRSIEIAAVVCLLAVAVASAAPPKCEQEKTAMLNAEKAMHDAWKEWQKVFDKEKAASERAERLQPRATAARAELIAASANVDRASAASDRCHRANGYTAKCAAEERAELAARDRRARAAAAYHAAYDALNRALEEAIFAAEDERKLFNKALGLENDYHAAVDAYNRCLRGKKMA